MHERRRHTAICPVQLAVGMGDCDPAVTGMAVIAGVVRKVMARSRVWPPRCLPGLAINVELRHEFAAALTIKIEPGYWLIATHSVEDIIGENFRNRAWITIGEHRNTDTTIGQHRHQRTTANKTASVPHNALSAIPVRAEAEAIMYIAVLGEFGSRDMHARHLQLLYQRR